MKFSLVRRLAACAMLFFLTAGTLTAAGQANSKVIGGTTGFAGVDPQAILKNIDASADIFEYVGDNMIARGHVVLITKTMILKADNVVIHLPTRDLEAFGNVSLLRRVTSSKNVDLEEYHQLLDDVNKKVEIVSVTQTMLGKKQFTVKLTETTAHIQAERLAGNLDSGELRFENFAMKSGAMYALAEFAKRNASGEIVADNPRFTTCDYVLDNHDHYAFTASKAYITPRSYHSGLENYNADHSDHSVLLVNSILRFWDTPLLWLPALYKPRETDSFGIDLTIGYKSEWGTWIRSSKNFELYDDPYVNVGLLVDFFSKRGWGGGLTTSIVTGNSRTELFGYAMRDRKPYLFHDVNEQQIEAFNAHRRLHLPKHRYDVMATNVTHITPRLDFRGQVEFTSDIDFREDYFEGRYESEPQPPTYAALEYQADWASFSVFGTGRTNSFDSVIQRTPEVRMDIFRQELFGGLYYQSENSAAYLYNRWRSFDRPKLFTASELKDMAGLTPSQYAERVREKKQYWNERFLQNYGSARIDSLHMFYYPLNFDFINIIPRAGVRLTAYSHTSKNKVTDEDLNAMFDTNSLYGSFTAVNNFQSVRDAKLRFMSEFGVEVNTKIYRSWQNVRSSWLGLDGLRHVMIPYVNYTYIPKPNLDYENILYFDDIDRLKEQNFARIGILNKLQTRDGVYGNEFIRQWASFETYWDFHAIKRDGFNRAGDWGFKFSFTPLTSLSFSAEMILDVGGNNEDNEYTLYRGKRKVEKLPGLFRWKILNALRASVDYKISEDWFLRASYSYTNQYWRRSVYSMGSMLETTNATSTSLKVLERPTQSAQFSIGFPTYIDKRLKGEFYMVYDVNQALMDDIGFRIMRDFHCFNVCVNVGCETDRDSDGKKDSSFYIAGFVGLTTMPSMQLGTKE